MRAGLLAGVVLVAAVPAAAAAEPRLDGVAAACAVVKLYEPCAITASVKGKVANPFDESEARLESTFTPPKGEPVTVGGFYTQPFEQRRAGARETVEPAGPPVWQVRFTPTMTGRWTFSLALVTPKGRQTLPAQSFMVVASAHKGFVRYDHRARRFQFDTGQPFIPIGENLCWGPSVGALASYNRWLHDLAKARANYIRVWMAPWLLRLETKDTGVGHVDLYRAWLLDRLLEQSAANGLYWQLVLLNHGSFSRSQDADWHNNPYNEALGGPCRSPNDFLTDPRAKALFERLLRYMVNRWGSSPQLVTWELFNEADYGEFRFEDLVQWHRQFSLLLHALDPQRRPVTTSFHREAAEAVWKLPAIDTVQLHVYDRRDFTEAFREAVPKPAAQFGKPVFIGEFGWISDVMRKFDDIGIHVHEGLWAGLMGGAAGTPLIWYWDTYVHPNGIERQFRAVEAFWRGEELDGGMQPLRLALSTPGLDAVGIGDDRRAFLWVRNRAHSLDEYVAYRCAVAKQRLRAARGAREAPLRYAPAPVQQAVVTVKGLEHLARYRVEWWDPYRGRVTARDVRQAEWGRLTLAVPELRFDLAAKLIKLQWWERG